MADEFIETIRSVHAALEELSDKVVSRTAVLETIASDIHMIKNQLIELQKKIG